MLRRLHWVVGEGSGKEGGRKKEAGAELRRGPKDSSEGGNAMGWA